MFYGFVLFFFYFLKFQQKRQDPPPPPPPEDQVRKFDFVYFIYLFTYRKFTCLQICEIHTKI